MAASKTSCELTGEGISDSTTSTASADEDHVSASYASDSPRWRSTCTARAATDAIAEAFPALYRFDLTPVPRALWTISRDGRSVAETADGWYFDRRRPGS